MVYIILDYTEDIAADLLIRYGGIQLTVEGSEYHFG